MHVWFVRFKWTCFINPDRITWTKDGDELDLESGNDFTYDSERGELTIGSVTSRLAGVYACSATNAFGSARSNTVLLKEAGKKLKQSKNYSDILSSQSTLGTLRFGENAKTRVCSKAPLHEKRQFWWLFSFDFHVTVLSYNLALSNNFVDVIPITSNTLHEAQ